MIERETAPEWLGPDTRFGPDLLERLLDARVVFYPGAGDDLHPLDIFGRTGAAHCFIHADYDGGRDNTRLPPLKGYRVVHAEDIDFAALSLAFGMEAVHPYGNQWQEFATWDIIAAGRSRWVVMQRSSGEGPEFLSLLQAFAEAVWFYQQFWVKRGRGAFAILLQDHTRGLNWSPFGGFDSPLYEVAQAGPLPEYLVVAENTTAWPGYAQLENVGSGGSASQMRALYERISERF